MKKLVSLLLALMMLLGMTAFAEAAVDYTGLWALTGVAASGVTVDPTALGLDMSMELYEDGTCALIALGEEEMGAWVVTEGGVAVTDADGVTMDMLLTEDGALTVEQDGAMLIFTREEYVMPLAGLTVADFNGEWVFEYMEMYDYAQMTQGVYAAEEVGVEMALSLADGKGHLVMSYVDGKDEYDGECVIEEVAELGSVMYFMLLDENGVQDGSGMMLMMYPDDELTWFEYDQEAQLELYYNFIRAAE